MDEKGYKKYQEEVYEQQNPYEMWISHNEKAYDEKMSGEYVIFLGREGELTKNAIHLLNKAFEEPKVDIVYGDEDMLDEESNKRKNPWFKPDFSPDALDSFLYMGNIIAFRTQVAKASSLGEEGISRDFDHKKMWDMLKIVAKRNGRNVRHIAKILFTAKEWDWSNESYCFPYEKKAGNRKVSIIIPSKDNPAMLKRCYQSVTKSKFSSPYEIIVVDNGSSEENRRIIEEFLDKDISQYIYEPFEFNFSRMCNIGAKNATGELLLFLNDDITIPKGNDLWLDKLAQLASRKETGAVGVKLYYPDSKRIQHVGITNMAVGPAHKLAGLVDDNKNFYHGRNLARLNMIAVTGAVLMLEKSKFDEVGGFYEGLPVAYNDVDLCFSLHESGYYNVLCNDIALYHHESVSRGSDESDAKKQRLLKEREMLYERHEELRGKDPYYNRNLVSVRLDAEYNVEFVYPFEDEGRFSKFREVPRGRLRLRENAMPIHDRLFKKMPILNMCIDSIQRHDGIVRIEGWSLLTKLDEVDYVRYIIVRCGTKAYCIKPFNKLRMDAAEVVTTQSHGLLGGFVVRIPEEIYSDSCQIGVIYKEATGRRRIVHYFDQEK